MSFARHSLVATALLVAAAGAFAHARLQSAEPGVGATVSAPAEVRLHFNEAVEPAMSTVKLFGASDAPLPLGKPVGAAGDAKTLVSTLPRLQAGDYRLEWSTMGHDGHHTKGEFRFSVK